MNVPDGGCPNPPWIPPERADEDGFVGIGGDLRPACLLRAYREGVFPWYSEGEPILWWSPDPRAIFELEHLYVARRLARTIRSGKFTVTHNRDFPGVIRGCAYRPDEGTWITSDMMAAYEELHRLGYAHSVETWIDGELVGGIYGVSVGGLFAAESMFHRVTDASKVALVALVRRLKEQRYELMDTQMLTEHTARMGAIEIPRRVYLERLKKAVRRLDVVFAK